MFIKLCLILAIVLTTVLGSFSGNATASEIPWTYQAATGPEHWAELDEAFALCRSGKHQSPTNLTAGATADLANPDFHYEPVPLNLLNNGHTVKVPYAPGSYVVIDGERYNLLQFHFHSPSEHTIDNQPWDAELHLVHQSEAGKLAVVAILLQQSEPSQSLISSSAYNNINNNLPTNAGDKIRTGTTINAQDLLPTKTTSYRYTGSLTTPPCSESVTWLVLNEPVTLNQQHITRYAQLLAHNNRPLQPLNERTVQIDVSP